MKNLKLVIILICSLQFTITNLQAQVPNLINYQAVARDLSGNPLVSTPVTVVFEIRQTSPLGTIVYNETHVSSTNQFGLFNLEIGGGTPITGTFAGINWSTGLYYLVVTVNGDVMPSTQLLSVPFALHANTASSGTPGANGHANLADSISEPPGPNCANGGYLIKMGADDNDDGTLQPLEEDITYYICNGIDGATTSYTAGTGINILAVGNIIENTGDLDSTNEIQTISISNDTIYLSNGGYVVLPNSSGDDWGAQTVIVDGVTIFGDGAATPLSGFDGNYNSLTNQPTIPTQTSDLINDSGFITSPIDADSDPNNEIELPATAVANQVLTWNGSAWVAQNPGSGADNWGSQVVMVDSVTIFGDGAGTPLSGFNGQYSSLTGAPTNVSSFSNDAGYLTSFVEVDGSITNELQVLSFSNDTLYLSNGNSVYFPPAVGDNWGTDTVNTFGTNISGNGTSTNPLVVTDADADSTNELQTLSFTSPTLSISGGNSVNLGALTGPTYTAGTGINLAGNIITNTAPDQTVALNNGTGINVTGTYPNFTVANTSPASSTSITGGGLTTVTGTSPSFTVTTPAQTLSFTSPNLTLSNGGGTISLPTGTVTSVTGSGNIASSGGATPNITFTGILPITNGGTNNGTLGSAGRIIYSNGTQYVSSAVGTVGQVLQSNGAGVPTWVSPSLLGTDNQNLSSTFSPGTVTVNITGGTGTTFSIDDADANPANELITSFGVNGTSDSLVIMEGINNYKAVPLTSIAAAGKWTESGGVLYPTNFSTNNVGIGANNALYTKLNVFNSTEFNSVKIVNSLSSPTQTNGLVLDNNGIGTGNKVGIELNTSGVGGVNNTGINSTVSGGSQYNTAFDGQAYPDVSTLETTVFKGRIIGGTGNAQTYGINVVNQSSSLGDAFGGYFANSNINASTKYGVRTDVTGNAVIGEKYGIFSIVLGSALRNYAGYFSASGATNNYAAIFDQGNVGIGTGSPSAKLHLEGSLRLNNLSGTAPAVGSVLTSIDALGNAEWAPPATTTTYWNPNGTDIYNNNAGNVGIGTSGAPNAKLEVRHAGTLGNILLFPTATSDPLTINALGGGAKYIKLLDVNGITMKFGTNGFVGLLGTSSNHSLSLMANGSIAMTILQNGNIGIGTSTPTSTLKVNGSIAGNFIAPNVSNYTCVPKDYFVYITIGGSVSLPLANSVDAGSVIIIRNQTGSNELVSVQGTDSVFPMNSCVGGCASMAIVSTPSTSTSARFISDGVNKWIEW